ncbi:F0F1 ATP synthase subunit epsilon [Candidatus Kaiserbacteria bacterium]|nr:F0F1 ATP synthase subunit epsilon [Candidatus Kaiserbacteria bacterium]
MAHQNTFRLVIASVGETRFDDEALSVTLPGAAGELTILPHHEPLVTTLRKGKIIVKDQSGSPKEFEVVDGVLECSGNRAVVLL